MTFIKEMWVLKHLEWYTNEEGLGYQPTDQAPPEAVEALKKLNEFYLKKYGKL